MTNSAVKLFLAPTEDSPSSLWILDSKRHSWGLGTLRQRNGLADGLHCVCKTKTKTRCVPAQQWKHPTTTHPNVRGTTAGPCHLHSLKVPSAPLKYWWGLALSRISRHYPVVKCCHPSWNHPWFCQLLTWLYVMPGNFLSFPVVFHLLLN